MPIETNPDEQTLCCILEAIRLGNPLRSEALFVDRYPFLNTFRGLTVQHKLINYLTGSITHCYNRLRQTVGFAPVTTHEPRTPALALLRNDFMSTNKELEAWSLLFNRYVRIDLDLSLQDVSHLVGQSVRNLNRRQSLGLTRLLSHMARQQVRFGRHRQNETLRAALPCALPPHLVGREPLLSWATTQLVTGAIRHLLIYGLPGVGKSVFAGALAHRLIDELAFSHVIWLDHCEAHHLVEQVAQRLGQPSESLPVYLQRAETLVLLDDARFLMDDPEAGQLLQHWLGAARLIVCSDQLPPYLPEMSYLHLPDLEKSAALDYLMMRSQAFSPHQYSGTLQNFEMLFHQVGGNPQALLRATLNRGIHVHSIAEELCGPLWETISPLSRTAWMIASQWDQAEPRIQAHILARSGRLADALAELERMAILSWNPESQTYGIAPLAKTFACYLIAPKNAKFELRSSQPADSAQFHLA